MKRMVRWMLFETWAGDCLLWLVERCLGVAVAPVESLAERDLAWALLDRAG